MIIVLENGKILSFRDIIDFLKLKGYTIENHNCENYAFINEERILSKENELINVFKKEYKN